MKNYKDIVMRISEEGHGAGFHSVTHDVKELSKTPESALHQFYICRNTYKEIYSRLEPHHKIVEEKIANTDLAKVGELLKDLREILEDTIDIDI